MQNIPHLKWIGIVVGSFLLPLSFASAQSCGDFISTYDFGDELTEEREPVGDCANPFGETDGPELYVPTVTIDGTVVENNGQVLVTELPVTQSLSIVNGLPDYFLTASLVRHEDEDYRYIDQFVTDTITFSATGTYTLIATYFEPPVLAQKKSMLQKIASSLVPTVFAQSPDELFFEVYATTFTVDMVPVESPAPTGASSVLFLPGIQASRLYTEGVLGTENQLWEPNINADVIKLAMTESGDSINDIYTSDVIEEITGYAIGSNIYKGFLSMLSDLRDEEIIADYQPFAYDWRYSVFDVATKPVLYRDQEVKLLREEVLRLAEESFTHKVTIIGHSNGGLVAKALLYEYGDTELAGKVDKLIMIGTPQLGTPKGIGAMLHGTDQQKLGGLIVDDFDARAVIQNMPGAYSLLPSNSYFTEVLESSLVLSDDSDETASVSSYGIVNTRSSLEDFLLDSQNVLPDGPSVNQPLTLNSELLSLATAEQDILDVWQAPNGVDVYEVVGTGLATIRGFEYRAFACKTSVACLSGTFMKPYPLFTNEGDETVVAGSAEGYDGDKTTAVVDLIENNAGLAINMSHADLTESSSVLEFVDSVIKYPYLNTSVIVPDFSSVSSEYTIIGTHSPVIPRIVTENGLIIGRDGNDIKEEIIGSQYMELGGSVYLIIPSVVEDYVIELTGTDFGPYTLTIEELDNANDATSVAVIVASSSDSLHATLSITDGDFGTLKSDTNGDGIFDEERTLEGELVIAEKNYTYDDLLDEIEAVDHRSSKKYLKFLGHRAARYNKLGDRHRFYTRLEGYTLRLLDRSIHRLEQSEKITVSESKHLIEIVDYLK